MNEPKPQVHNCDNLTDSELKAICRSINRELMIDPSDEELAEEYTFFSSELEKRYGYPQ